MKLDNIYYSFIITIAVELCTFNIEKRYAVSLTLDETDVVECRIKSAFLI